MESSEIWQFKQTTAGRFLSKREWFVIERNILVKLSTKFATRSDFVSVELAF
ncbi:hypothetical protein [Helicobacter labetoulli]|uniref:hypothetical protein n=1 Tax=Helicobacter labetoulli TaxID=2315333 RepID=UPI00130024DB|nr:hypothetical protein [Helicobacter labetoulli]